MSKNISKVKNDHFCTLQPFVNKTSTSLVVSKVNHFPFTLKVVFFTQILIPFVILVYCTVRIVQRLRKKTVGDKTKLRRAVFLVTSVVIVFSVCFLPCTLARAVLLATRLLNKQDEEILVAQVYDGLMVLSYIDCLLDPLLYCFCCSGFRDAYMEAFCPAALMRRMSSFDNSNRMTTTTNSLRIVNVPLVQM